MLLASDSLAKTPPAKSEFTAAKPEKRIALGLVRSIAVAIGRPFDFAPYHHQRGHDEVNAVSGDCFANAAIRSCFVDTIM